MDVDKVIRRKFRVKPGDLPPYTGWKHSLRKDLYVLFNDLGYVRGVELGVHVGRNSREMFKAIPKLDLTLIDPWRKYNRSSSDEGMASAFKRCKQRLSHWNPKYIRKTGSKAVKDIKDNSLDFVYIDGMHDFNSVMIDLIEWVPKVRKGGIVSGHDYAFGYAPSYGVIQGVNAYVRAHNITNLYLTGGACIWRDCTEPPSWFWPK